MVSKSCTPSDAGTPLGQIAGGQPRQAAHVPFAVRFTFPPVAWLLISSVAKKPHTTCFDRQECCLFLNVHH